MKKLEVNTEQIIAIALLLNLESITSVDIFLLDYYYLKENQFYNLDIMNLEKLRDYIMIKNGKISLKNGLNFDSFISEDLTLKEKLKQIATPQIIKYFENFDMEEFVLRKINHYVTLNEEHINGLFCEKERKTLKELIDKGYLILVWNDDIIYENYREIRLSDCGKLKLFKIDYREELEQFIKKINDTDLLDDYLLKQDLKQSIYSILKMENLEQFCVQYDRELTINMKKHQ